MLTGMELPGTAAPWLVLGVVLGILAPVLAGLAVGTLRRRAAPAPPVIPPPPALADDGADDLPGFLASPPGSAPAPAAPAAGWPPLSGPATPPPAAPSEAEPAHGRTGSTGLLVALALTAVLLIGAAAAVAATRTGDPTVAEAPDPTGEPEPGTTGTAAPGEVSAELTFEGVVLERHAVGVTAA